MSSVAASELPTVLRGKAGLVACDDAGSSSWNAENQDTMKRILRIKRMLGNTTKIGSVTLWLLVFEKNSDKSLQ
jgi:hypothetical protein